MKKDSQCQRVLDYIRQYGSITVLEAFTELGIARLGSRIHDLRNDGYRINGEIIAVRNRFGEKVHCMKYTLEE